MRSSPIVLFVCISPPFPPTPCCAEISTGDMPRPTSSVLQAWREQNKPLLGCQPVKELAATSHSAAIFLPPPPTLFLFFLQYRIFHPQDPLNYSAVKPSPEPPASPGQHVWEQIRRLRGRTCFCIASYYADDDLKSCLWAWRSQAGTDYLLPPPPPPPPPSTLVGASLILLSTLKSFFSPELLQFWAIGGGLSG